MYRTGAEVRDDDGSLLGWLPAGAETGRRELSWVELKAGPPPWKDAGSDIPLETIHRQIFLQAVCERYCYTAEAGRALRQFSGHGGSCCGSPRPGRPFLTIKLCPRTRLRAVVAIRLVWRATTLDMPALGQYFGARTVINA